MMKICMLTLPLSPKYEILVSSITKWLKFGLLNLVQRIKLEVVNDFKSL